MARTLVALAAAGLLLVAGWFSFQWWSGTQDREDIVFRGKYVKPKGGVDFLRGGGKKGLEAPGELIVGSDKGPEKELPGMWERFRGPNFDAVAVEDVPLADSWPAEGPKQLWAVDCGEGYAGAAVRFGRVYLHDYDQEKQADALRCFDLATGKELWRRWYNVYIRRQHGYSRTVPAVSDKYVVTMGPLCHVMCCDPITGEAKWAIDLVKDYESEVPEWYAAQCPLIDEIDGKQCAIIAPGGKALMFARDCETGELVWETPNPKGYHMTHSSIVPLTVAGTKMYVIPMTGGVIGVEAATGKLLWRYSRWTISPANVPMPIVPGDGKIFLSGGYGRGSMMIQIVKQGETFAVREVFKVGPKICGSDQQTPILHKNFLYQVLPKDAGGTKEQLTCLDLNGKQIWVSGSEAQFGIGPYLIADDKIILCNDNGLLTMAKATSSGYVQLAQHKVLQGHDCWAPLAIAGGRLLVRDLKRLICLDLRATGQ